MELSDSSKEQTERYAQQSATAELSTLLRILDILSECADKMNQVPDRSLSLEMCFIKICQNTVAEKTASQSGFASPTSSAVKQQPVSVQQNKKEPEAPVPVQTATADGQPELVDSQGNQALAQWSQIVESLREKDRLLFSTLQKSKAYLDNNRVLISADDLFLQYIRKSTSAKEIIKQAITEITGQRYNIGPYIAKDAPKGSDENPQPDSLDDIDDLISRAKRYGVFVVPHGGDAD